LIKFPNPDQPRRYFNPGKLANLLSHQGKWFNGALIVVPKGGRLMIIAGERRCALAG